MKRHPILVMALIVFTILFILASRLLRQTQPQISVQQDIIPTRILITPTSQLAPTPTPPPTAVTLEKPFPPIHLAWFTNVPHEKDIPSVLEWFDLFIFHRNEEDRRDLMIKMGARGPILQYLLFEAIHDPGSCTDQPNSNQVAYLPGDFCSISEQHPDWFLLNHQGQRILIQDDHDNYYLMDSGNPDWRSFYLDRIRQTQADPNWDGVFLDNVPATLAFREKSGNLPAGYPDDASYQTAVQGLLKYLYEGYFRPENKLLFANLVSRRDDADWVNELNYLDGVMHEGWAIDWPTGYRPPETWEKQMELAEQTQELGKSIILVSQGTQDDIPLQRFAFASYLLINRGNAFFRYANSDEYRSVWLYEDYMLNLGTPIGPRYQDGITWRRAFTNGNVAVNPATHEVVIKIK